MRNVIIGKNSKVWHRLEATAPLGSFGYIAIGHAELQRFEFLPSDRVWLFSYSPDESENRHIIDTILAATIESMIYVSSSSTVVAESTNCYGYPRVKLAAERYASRAAHARILTLGLVYEDPSQLPAGESVATSIKELAEFIAKPCWSSPVNGRFALMHRVDRPYSGLVELACHKVYGCLINAMGAYPCFLRPLDALLKVLGFRWYGYTYLSNQQWMRNISS